jgi:2-amino-4-hydroxy-6-hydroxymethyldihydropteridine diphosphokinase
VLVETTLAPHDLLHALQAIETANGRDRHGHWGSRTLDLDIVRYGDLVLTTSDLTLPHPGVATRDFWQRELAELAPHER